MSQLRNSGMVIKNITLTLKGKLRNNYARINPSARATIFA